MPLLLNSSAKKWCNIPHVCIHTLCFALRTEMHGLGFKEIFKANIPSGGRGTREDSEEGLHQAQGLTDSDLEYI